MPKTKILIADDHEMIREGIKALLGKNKNYQIIGEALNGLDAVNKYFSLKPDLVILDISISRLVSFIFCSLLLRLVGVVYFFTITS